MTVERDSVHFRILERLCTMPKPVRGISGAMLDRHFGAPDAVEELAHLGLIQGRGWANGPGMVWIPTAAGETLYEALANGRERAAVEPVNAPGDPASTPAEPRDDHAHDEGGASERVAQPDRTYRATAGIP